MRQIKK